MSLHPRSFAPLRMTRSFRAGGEIDVDATSGSSGLRVRDHRMKDAILETQKFPRIQFVPRRVDAHVEADGRFQAKLRGVLTLHGTEHEMTIDAEGHLNDQQVDATCAFSIPYVEWGLADPSLPLLSVSKVVEIRVTTAGHVVWER